MLFKDRVADHDDTSVVRLRTSGAVLAAQTTAPEFGGINCTSTELHGTTRNPWNLERTPGGSSGGSAAAVAGGLLPIATGSDGGGSIRGPAGFSGLFGLKATYGRIPKGPEAGIEPMTTVLGCLSRSVRDTARYFDCCNGFDPTRPAEPARRRRVGGRARHLRPVGHDRGDRGRPGHRPGPGRGGRPRGRRGDAPGRRGRAAAGHRGAHAAPAARGSGPWRTSPPSWSTSATPTPTASASSRREMRAGLEAARERYDLERAASIERYRRQLNEAMADLFDQADFVFCSTHPDVAFAAEGPPPSTIPGADLIHEIGFTRAIMNNAALTAPSNLNGSPAASIPAGLLDGLPVGLQVLAGHHREELLLDLALVAERAMPWPVVAPGSPLRAG